LTCHALSCSYAIGPLSACLPCLSCLSVTLVHCGQTVGWIKTKLGMQVGLGPGHIVLHGDTPPLHKEAQPPIFGSYLLRPNSCMDQDATWYGGRPQPRRLSVRWGPRSPSPNMEVGLIPGDFVLDRTQPPSSKRAKPLPNFRPISIVVKRLDASRCHLVRR